MRIAKPGAGGGQIPVNSEDAQGYGQFQFADHKQLYLMPKSIRVMVGEHPNIIEMMMHFGVQACKAGNIILHASLTCLTSLPMESPGLGMLIPPPCVEQGTRQNSPK